ncbi:hypothetical protein MK280_18310 [Myxococcota bacterium]|nr:hypothetical protein [Myxococcota bacterium]
MKHCARTLRPTVFLVFFFLLAFTPEEALPGAEVGDATRPEFESHELGPIWPSPGKTLPRVEVGDGARLEFDSHELDPISLSSREDIDKFLAFYNERLDGWGTPGFGPPVAAVKFRLYENEELVGTFGMHTIYITRGFCCLSRQASESDVKSFTANFHPAVGENLFPVIPADKEGELKKAKEKLSLFKEGDSMEHVEETIRQNEVCTLAKSDPRFGNYFINVNLGTVHSGDYLDTVITGQLRFDEENKLVKERFLGFRISSNCPDPLS